MNVPTKLEVRSFTRSKETGVPKIGQSLDMPMLPFLQKLRTSNLAGTFTGSIRTKAH